jgi:hypothetical protein
MAVGPSTTKDRRGGQRKGAARDTAPAAPVRTGPRRKKQPRSAPPAEVELDADTLEFIAAIERYRKAQSRPFPSWSEVLHVLRSLGYRKPA